MTSTDNPVLRVQGPGDMLAAIPYLLGFHPTDSLVLVGLNGTSVVVTARIGIADLDNTPHLLGDTLVAIKRGGASVITAVIFSDTVTVHTPIATDLEEQATEDGITVLDILLVAGGRWWSLGCTNPDCCPPEGTPLPDAPTVFDAAATYAGLTALPSRDDLAGMLTSLPDRQGLAGLLEHHHHEQLNAILSASTTATSVRLSELCSRVSVQLRTASCPPMTLLPGSVSPCSRSPCATHSGSLPTRVA